MGYGSQGMDDRGGGYIWNTLFVCRFCRKGIVVRLFYDYSTDPMACEGDPRTDGFHLESVYPEPITPSAPDHVPNPLAKNFIEALTNLQGDRFTSAGIMFRKVLETSTKQLAPGTDGDNLKKRISKLVTDGKIAAEMGELADCIRDEGNVAAHEEEFDQESAEQIHEFTYLYLTYVYTLPHRIQDANAKRKAKKAKKP